MSLKKIFAVVMACLMAIGAFAASALTLDVAEAAGETADEAAVLAAETSVSTAEDFYNAVANAQPGDVINLTESVSYNVWNSVSGKSDITINGNGNTITVTDSIYSNGNGGALLRNASNLTINDLKVALPATPTAEMERLAIMSSGTLNKVTVTGGTFAVSIVGKGVVEINNCTFTNLGGWAIETEGKDASASLTITGSTFDEAAVILRGENNTFTDNKIVGAGEGVNVLGDAVITGNDFGASTLGIDRGVEVTVEKNIINNVELSSWLTGEYNVTVENNTLSDAAVETLKTVDETVESVDPVASVNGKAYYSLTEALAALEEGDTLALATGKYDGFDVLVDNVTITGMTADTVITINSIPGNAFIGVNAEGVSVENLTFVIPENCAQANDGWDGFDAVIGYWSNNFSIGSRVTTGYDVKGCTFINEGSNVGVAMFNFSSFEISGNTFENFNVGIHTMSDGSAMGTVVINNNTFTKVNEPVNVYWGQNGEDNNRIAITGNNFVSAKDADAIKVTVHDHASKITGTAGIDAIDLSGNIYSVATEVVLVDAASDVSADAKEDLENAENVVLDNKHVAVARIGNDKFYTTLDAAIADVKDGDTVTVLNNVTTDSFTVDGTISAEEAVLAADGKTFVVDLNSYTWYLKDVNSNGTTRINHKNGANVTYKNGTINVSEAVDSVNFFSTGVYDKTAATMTFENVTVVGDGYNSGYAVFYLCGNSDSVLNIINSTINLANEKGSAGGVIKADNQDSKVNITGTTMVLDNVQRGIVSATTTIDNSTIEFKNLKKTALRNFNGTINNSTITVAGAEYGIENDATSALAINVTGNSFVKLLGAAEYDLSLTAGGTALTIEEGSVLYADTSDIVDASTVTGNAVILANVVEVVFEKVDGDAEGYDLYNINLVGVNGEVINRLNSADLTFKFVATAVTGGAMDYEILPVKNVTLTSDTTTPNEHRYMFNFNGKDVAVIGGKDTANVITLAQVKVSGYGTYTFSVDTSDEANKTNTAHATTISDNIVDTFVPGGATGKGELKLDESTTGEVTIAVPVRTLTVNIAFPNSVVDNDVLYQDMKVEITGNIDGVHQTVTYKLGGNMQADGTYVVTEDRLVLNEAYNVVVSGAGYRTARYTVTMTDAKVLNFWNNVKDNDTVVEEGKLSEKKNFLAGDIVGDNQINIYDLSAVVSYFATDATTDYAKYVKYDLNRDGVIDSKDVAYVLVSWGA